MHKRLHKSSLSLALNYQIKDGRIYRLLAPSAAGIGAPLVPAVGWDEPRKTAKCVKPTQMAQDVLYCNKFDCIQKRRKITAENQFPTHCPELKNSI